ncbi:MAG TPA: chromate efflux transporter [Puia sp.]|jgi:chromate transporter
MQKSLTETCDKELETTGPGRPAFKEALRFWFKLGWISFGGTAGHIAIMHDFLVDKKKWISNSRFLHALSLCMLLPGPEAQQLAIYIGQQLHGKKGGLIAGIFFVLPSMLILLLLSIIYVLYGNLPWIYGLFSGLKPCVIALIIIALFKIARTSLKGVLHYGVSAVAFAAIFFFNISLLLIIIATILLAVVIRSFNPSLLHGDRDPQDKDTGTGPGFNIRSLAVQLIVFLLFWSAPFVALYFFSGDFAFWKHLILFFTQTAFFTIGGSYTVLPYVAQFAVAKFSWLSKMQMVDGFALAETTPGPLIIVVGFVGFMAGYNHFSGSILQASLALLLTTFYTFLPCFLYIFAGAPLIERSHGSDAISGILKLVMAAIVGVIFNLAIYLGRDVVFPAGLSIHHIDWVAVGWILLSLVLIARFSLNVVFLILLSITLGILRYQLHF